MSTRRHSFLRWSENPRQGRGGGWMRFEQGSDRWRDSSRRYQFDETLNNAIHGILLINIFSLNLNTLNILSSEI